jgi:hypothetical protein
VRYAPIRSQYAASGAEPQRLKVLRFVAFCDNCGHIRRLAPWVASRYARGMTPDDFRRLALTLPGVEEVFRYGQSQFRVGRKTFAILEGVADSVAVVMLTQEQQAMFAGNAPSVFTPVSGGDGRLGITSIRLEAAREASLTDVLTAAWSNVAPKRRLKRRGLTEGS